MESTDSTDTLLAHVKKIKSMLKVVAHEYDAIKGISSLKTVSVGNLISGQAMSSKAYQVPSTTREVQWYRAGTSPGNAGHHNTMMMVFHLLQDRGYMILRHEQKLCCNLLMDGVPLMLLGMADVVMMNPYTRRLCVLDLKTSSLGAHVAIDNCFLTVKNELQLRLYGMMLFKCLELTYAPELYVFGVRESTEEAALYSFTARIRDIKSLGNVFQVGNLAYSCPKYTLLTKGDYFGDASTHGKESAQQVDEPEDNVIKEVS